MGFDLHIGIDYSGAQAPESRLRALQVYASADGLPERVLAPSKLANQHWNWSRQEIAEWLIGLVSDGTRFIGRQCTQAAAGAHLEVRTWMGGAGSSCWPW